MFIVGNKLDKTTPGNIIDDESISRMASVINVNADRSFKCSAKTGENVVPIFDKVAEVCLQECQVTPEEEEEDNFVIKADEKPQRQDQKKCC